METKREHKLLGSGPLHTGYAVPDVAYTIRLIKVDSPMTDEVTQHWVRRATLLKIKVRVSGRRRRGAL